MLVKSKSGKEIGIFTGRVLEVGEGDKRFTVSGDNFSVALNYEGERVYINVVDGKHEVEVISDKPENNDNGKKEKNDKKDDEQGEGDDTAGHGDEGGDDESEEEGDEPKKDGEEGDASPEEGEENSNGDDNEGTPSPTSRRYTRIV